MTRTRFDNVVNLGGLVSAIAGLSTLGGLIIAIVGPLAGMHSDIAAIKVHVAAIDASVAKSDGSLADAERRWGDALGVLRSDVREMDRRYAIQLRLRLPLDRD